MARMEGDSKEYAGLRLIYTKVEGGQFLGECMELGTATNVGHSTQIGELIKETRELTLEHLNTLEATGERQRFFAEHGIEVYPEPTTPPPLPEDIRSKVLLYQTLIVALTNNDTEPWQFVTLPPRK